MAQRDDQAVRVNTDSDIAIITIDNPPVNALSQAVRQGLADAVRAIVADPAVSGAVLVGAGRVFIAGADVREFDQPPKAPPLTDVIAQIEAAAKPVVAAIHGVALGGGLEVALGCHYRVAAPDAKVGLPEVSLGLIPGAGGTQRLPRLIGIEAAAEAVTSGRHIEAREAARLGLLDALAGEDAALEPFAVEFARTRVGRPVPRLSSQSVTAPESAAFLGAAHEKLAHKARGQESPLRALEAIRVALDMPFAEGMAREGEIFQALRASSQARALRHVFFAERAVSKAKDLGAATPRPIESVAVIGGGTMGAGIAVASLRAGLGVCMLERDEAGAAKGRANVQRNLEGFVTRARMNAAQKDEHLKRFRVSTDYAGAAEAGLVIEAVFEDMALKKDVFRALDAVMPPAAVLATNTSYLDVNEIALATQRPGEVIGLHFFSPAHVMRLLEIVKGSATRNDVLATGFAFAKRLNKIGVLSGVCDGFIGNRILARTRKQCDYMIEDGATPFEVDEAMEAFGMAMGPFRVMDLAGLDIGWATRKRQAPTRDPRERYVAIADRICEHGWFGQKTGRGWYLYESGATKPRPNPEVEAIIRDESAKKGITRRPFGREEIQNRVLFAMINEAANVVDEQIAQRPLDVDVVEIHGYGFPRYKGGPMCYADELGLDTVLTGIRELATQDPIFWQAAPLIERLVAQGKRFADLNGVGV